MLRDSVCCTLPIVFLREVNVLKVRSRMRKTNTLKLMVNSLKLNVQSDNKVSPFDTESEKDICYYHHYIFMSKSLIEGAQC